ncbi:unnamed protein product [Moneuplotes crassus]|uniref:Transmembrane protein n=1 Tax=Euplotes crassus TaxID=5936 RepID=A0AAD1XPV0_EUPCR|nr:unnamed protein product [Moneuplotes crassus]
MSALKQLEEYRRKQAERFKEEEDEESYISEEIKEVQEMAEKINLEERKLQEQKDIEYCQHLERNINFREGYGDDLEENKFGENFDDIGHEGTPARVPTQNQYNYMADNSLSGQRNNRETFVRQEPPKWLVQPIHIDQSNQVKIFDFTDGSRNQEMRNTTDSSVNYEFETMQDPIFDKHTPENLESLLHEKQKKRLEKFEEQEDIRFEEAKRNGQQIDEARNFQIEEEHGVNSPLLGDSPSDRQQNQQNNQNMGQNRAIIPGILIRQPNGAFRVCCFRDLSRQFLLMILIFLLLIIACAVFFIAF